MIYLIQWLFKIVLISIFMNFPLLLLLLISGFHCGKHDLVLSLRKIHLWPNTWSFLQNVACVLGKNMHVLLLGGVFCTQLVGPIGLWCPFEPSISLAGAPWISTPCRTVSPFFVSICFICIHNSMFGAHVYNYQSKDELTHMSVS